MAGTGTGYPNWWMCPTERKRRSMSWAKRSGEWERRYTVTEHEVVRTGRTKAAPSPTKGHSRKLRESHEYECLTCKRTGWTCHIDILKFPLRGEVA